MGINMDTNELEALKQGVEGATAGFLRSFHDLVSKLAGPAVEEMGMAWQDHVRVWRFSRALRLAKNVQKLLEDNNQPVRPVQLKVLLPALEHASIEDDDYLQDHWATLLANAADPKHQDNMLSVFVEILKQLSGNDARLLDHIYRDFYGDSQDAPSNEIGNKEKLEEIFEAVYVTTGRDLPVPDTGHNGDVSAEFSVSLENLLRLGLVSRRQMRRTQRDNWFFPQPPEHEDIKEVIQNLYYFTRLGKSFVLSCRPRKETTA
jgi:hypothetical protein